MTRWDRVRLFARKQVDKLLNPPMGEEGSVRGRLGYESARGYDAIQDDLLAKKGIGAYNKMRHDPDVKAGIMIKTAGVLSKGWSLTPATEEDDPEHPEAERQMDFVQEAFDAMPGSLDDVLEDILFDGLTYGTSIAEKNWRIETEGEWAGRYMLQAIKPKAPSRYKIKTDDYGNITGLSLQRLGGDLPLTVEKFLIFAYQSAHGDPWGLSDLRAAYFHWWSKTKIMSWWNIFTEKYAAPTAKGTYRRGLPTDDQTKLRAVLDKIQQETAITLPEDVGLELLTANQSSADTFEKAIQYHGKQIIRAIIGQTLTTDEGQRVGSLALGRVHESILSVYVAKLKRQVEEFVDEGIIRDLIDYNFPPPRYYPNFALLLEEKDLASLSESMFRLASVEIIDPGEPWLREYLGLPAREEPEAGAFEEEEEPGGVPPMPALSTETED